MDSSGRGSRKLVREASVVFDDIAEESLFVCLSRLSGEAEQGFICSIKRYATLFGQGQHGGYATACSGSDISSRCDEAISKMLAKRFGMQVDIPTVLSCEHNQRKARFIQAQHDVPIVVAKPEKLASVRVRNLREPGGPHVCVPALLKLLIGTPCVSRTPLNGRASENVNCVQESRDATGIAFAQVLDAVSTQWPIIMQNECVKGLMQNKKTTREAERR